MNKRATGDNYEQRAQQFLTKQRLKIVACNVHCRFGEIDIVASSGKILIFVEVRYRHNPQFGGAAASVTASKRQKITLCAQWFLQQHPQYQNMPCRFDVIAFENQQLNWFKQAFDA